MKALWVSKYGSSDWKSTHLCPHPSSDTEVEHSGKWPVFPGHSSGRDPSLNQTHSEELSLSAQQQWCQEHQGGQHHLGRPKASQKALSEMLLLPSPSSSSSSSTTHRSSAAIPQAPSPLPLPASYQGCKDSTELCQCTGGVVNRRTSGSANDSTSGVSTDRTLGFLGTQNMQKPSNVD